MKPEGVSNSGKKKKKVKKSEKRGQNYHILDHFLLFALQGDNGNALLDKLHNKQIPIADFLQLAINCYATRIITSKKTGEKQSRFYQSKATEISSLINLFPASDWGKYLS